MAEVEKAKHLLADLFDYYAAHIDEVPEDYRAISEGDDLRAVTDYIAGMTDRYATATYQRLFIPTPFRIREGGGPSSAGTARRGV